MIHNNIGDFNSGFYRKNNRDIISSLGSRLHGYTNPNILSSMTYHKMGTVSQSGTANTSTYFYEDSNSAWTFTNKFTISMWIQPKELYACNGIGLIWRYLANVSGDWVYDLQPQSVGGAVYYQLRYYAGGGQGYVTTKGGDANILSRPFGHIMAVYDGTLSSDNRLRFYINGVDYTVADSNLTVTTALPTTLPACTRNILLGKANAGSNTDHLNAGISCLQVWKDNKWGDRTTLWNSGTPLTNSNLGALNDSTLSRSVDFDDELNTSSSSRQYYQCKKTLSNSFSPRKRDDSGWLAQPPSYFVTRINNLAPIGGYWSWRFGSMPELLHTELRATATTGLYNRGVLKVPKTNFSAMGSWSPVEGGRYTGDLTAISSALHGDFLNAVCHNGLTTGLAAASPLESFYLGTVNNASSQYVACGYNPRPGTTLPLYPTIRQRTAARNNGNEFINANYSVGDKRINHFGLLPSRGILDHYYKMTNLTNGVTTAGANTGGGDAAQWFGDVASIADMVLLSYNQGTSLMNADHGVYCWGSGWTESEKLKITEYIKSIYT